MDHILPVVEAVLAGTFDSIENCVINLSSKLPRFGGGQQKQQPCLNGKVRLNCVGVGAPVDVCLSGEGGTCCCLGCCRWACWCSTQRSAVYSTLDARNPLFTHKPTNHHHTGGHCDRCQCRHRLCHSPQAGRAWRSRCAGVSQQGARAAGGNGKEGERVVSASDVHLRCIVHRHAGTPPSSHSPCVTTNTPSLPPC